MILQDQLQSEFMHERFELINRFRFNMKSDYVALRNENLRFRVPKRLHGISLFHFVGLLLSVNFKSACISVV